MSSPQPTTEDAKINIGDRPWFLCNQGTMSLEENGGLSPTIINARGNKMLYVEKASAYIIMQIPRIIK
jgi:hypothetical protein